MADTGLVFTGYGCSEHLLPWSATSTPSVEEDWNSKIVGYGPEALSEIFARVARYGITMIRTMSEERFNKLFGDVEYDDASVEQVINSLRFLRNPTLDIDSLYEETSTKIDEHWISFTPDQLFTERYMKDFKGSVYFDLLSEKRQPAGHEVLEAWFTDLKNGLYNDRSYVHAIFDCDGANLSGHQGDLAFAELIIEYHLVEQLYAIPRTMLARAHLWTVMYIVSRLQQGHSLAQISVDL